MRNPLLASAEDLPVRRVRFWEHTRAVRQMVRAYPPGVDALVDRIHSMGFLRRFFLQRVVIPLYFAREQGWAVRDAHGELAAIMYLRRQERQGIRVMHIDDINVDARYRRQGLAQRLLQLAEDLARNERRPFLKLAVTVGNTPAVTLYRRLGYQEQRHRYFTLVPSAPLSGSPVSADLQLRLLHKRQAKEAIQRVYEMELKASAPALAQMLATYYPLEVPREAQRMYAIEQDGQLIGYSDIYRREARWNLDLGLHPALWGTEQEQRLIHRLTQVLEGLGHSHGSTVALHLPTTAHGDAVRFGAQALERDWRLTQQSYDRMIMAKVVMITP
jgi:GNAT superfamily N-acetyltransferase